MEIDDLSTAFTWNKVAYQLDVVGETIIIKSALEKESRFITNLYTLEVSWPDRTACSLEDELAGKCEPKTITSLNYLKEGSLYMAIDQAIRNYKSRVLLRKFGQTSFSDKKRAHSVYIQEGYMDIIKNNNLRVSHVVENALREYLTSKGWLV